jgi:hypothetical protein
MASHSRHLWISSRSRVFLLKDVEMAVEPDFVESRTNQPNPGLKIRQCSDVWCRCNIWRKYGQRCFEPFLKWLVGTLDPFSVCLCSKQRLKGSLPIKWLWSRHQNRTDLLLLGQVLSRESNWTLSTNFYANNYTALL